MSIVLGLGREYARLLASRGAAVVGETDERAGGVVRVLIIGLLVVSYTGCRSFVQSWTSVCLRFNIITVLNFVKPCVCACSQRST